MRLLIVALTFASLTANAQDIVKTDFKGLVLGEKTSLDAVREEWKLDCGTIGRTCFGLTSIAEARAKVTLRLGAESELRSVTLDVDAGAFSRVAGALKEKFGTPTRTANLEVQNLHGTTLPSVTMTWERPDGARILASERGLSMTRALIEYTSAADVAIQTKLREKAKTDL